MAFKLSPTSPQQVLDLCSGEVRIDETISFKSKLPIRDGLFCQKIFGPIKDYTCECGKYEGKKYAVGGRICESCGVSIISSRSRSERMGYINLQLPIVHPICKTAVTSILSVQPHVLTSFLSGFLSCYVDKKTHNPNLCFNDGSTGKVRFVKVDDPALEASQDEYNDSSIALYNVFKEINVEETAKINDCGYLKIYKREKFDIKNLFLTYLPVSPPNYRPLIATDTHYSTDPKNDLYLRVCRRSIRLKRLLELKAINQIVCHENSLIYKAVDQLFYGGSTDGKTKLEGIIENIDKKDGLIRTNLLGKRVDYSGRSAITSSGDTIEMDQIGLPRKMAYELFKPFILSHILKNYTETYREANTIYDSKSVIAIKSMEDVVENRRVLLNRAPTLHRYGIMSFKVKLVDGETILLHPMVCTPFNADFDGDQVAIHVPLSEKSLEECEQLMSPEHNILASLDGQSQLNPSHEMVIGLDIMTNYKKTDRHTDTVFNSVSTLEYLYNTFDINGRRNLEINEQIIWRDVDQNKISCYGRILLEQLLKTKELPEKFTKSTIKILIGKCYNNFEPHQLLKVLHELMKLSLNFVTLSGFSIASKDCLVPSTKKDKVEIAKKTAAEYSDQYKNGLITEDKRYEDTIRLWDSLVKELQEDWKKEVPDDNSVKMMQSTGARVSMTQVSQLNVAKGLTTNTKNKIIETPIINCLKEGLTTYEYFSSCTGSRKSMADKISLTPKSGYLTRKMITVSRDFYIVEDDCKTDKGLFKNKKDSVGRFTCEGELVQPNSDESLIKVRSPIFCETPKGFCSKCYGLSPSTRKLVTTGTNVGAIAAQSLTESTTQMTMKTFHTSGAAVIKGSRLFVSTSIDGIVKLSDENDFTKIQIVSDKQTFVYYSDKLKSNVFVKTGQKVKIGDDLVIYTHEGLENDDVSGSLPKVESVYEARKPSNSRECLIASKAGKVRIELLIGRNVAIYIDDTLIGITNGVPVFVADGELVEIGHILSYGSPDISKFFLATNDLSAVYNIFESTILDICEKEDLFPCRIHLEVIFRCMSNLVLKEDGLYGLKSHGDVGQQTLMGIDKLSRTMPSWLKCIGYGFTKKTIQSSATQLRTTYDLSSEKLMYGGLIFEKGNNVRNNRSGIRKIT